MKFFLVFFVMSATAYGDDLRDRFMKQPHLVSDQTFGQVYEIMKKYQGAPESKEGAAAEEFRDLYCQGSTPRFIVARTVEFKPEIDSGIPLDGASDLVFKQVEMAKFFFAQDFFYSSGAGSDVSQHLLHRSFDSHDTLNDDKYISATDYHRFIHKNQQLTVDMGVLLRYFTFRIPENEIRSMYQTSKDMFRINKFGYKNGDFQASEAINFKDYIWRYVLIHDTEVKEAMKDGSTVYEVDWKPEYFCKYAVSLPSLKSL